MRGERLVPPYYSCPSPMSLAWTDLYTNHSAFLGTLHSLVFLHPGQYFSLETSRADGALKCPCWYHFFWDVLYLELAFLVCLVLLW